MKSPRPPAADPLFRLLSAENLQEADWPRGPVHPRTPGCAIIPINMAIFGMAIFGAEPALRGRLPRREQAPAGTWNRIAVFRIAARGIGVLVVLLSLFRGVFPVATMAGDGPDEESRSS